MRQWITEFVNQVEDIEKFYLDKLKEYSD